ncbi:hypothetical protein DM01DRAFT_1404273 [Hesseltinella vesiculosa]|uniref:Fanconi Anaemia group E protein C-terminal domain-containing protein n=1 Tax=Hesseltinella vesiculosa TaxID=101127 RepID=A0A1X2GTX9_9FUNG|nr:hypothetical protein DM01DRAFT_1404273 [Hesseltinella vesiculosa]
MSVDELLQYRKQQLKQRIQGQGYEFSQHLQQVFGQDQPSLDMMFPLLVNADNGPSNNDLIPLYRQTSDTLRPRKPRQLLQQNTAATTNNQQLSSQMSITDTQQSNDDLPEAIQTLVGRLRQLDLPPSSQQSQQDRSSLFLELLTLSPQQIQVACDQIQMEWTDALLVDLCVAMQQEANASHASVAHLIHAFVFPFVAKCSNPLPRLLISSLLEVTRLFDNVVVESLLLPLLEDAIRDNAGLKQSSQDMMVKLIQDGLGQHARLLLLRFLLSGTRQAALESWKPPQWQVQTFATTALQLMNRLCTSPALVQLDHDLVRRLLATCRWVIQQQPKNKEAMQVLLGLASKHRPVLVEGSGELLDELGAIAKASQMILKRAILGIVTSLKKKRQLPKSSNGYKKK